MKLRALTVGESVVLGEWVVTRNRRDSYTLTSYPFKLGSRTRFGTAADIQEDLARLDQMGCLPPVVKGWA